MVIYTANYGDKDRFREPRVNASWNKDLKFVYFTDQPVESDVWDVRVEKKSGDSQRLAKWYKINSHEVFPGERTIWIDASIRVLEDPTWLFEGWENMMVRTHPLRKDIYEEAECCIESNRGDVEDINAQVKDYEQQGFPEDYGLFLNGILFRKPTRDSKEVNQTWWKQICKYSSRDQISLPYVLYKQDILFKTVDTSYFKQCFSKAGRHKFRGTKELT